MLRTRARLSVLATLAMAATSISVVAAQAAHASTALTPNWYLGAPYAYEPDSAGPDLTQAMSATGVKAFVLAFVLADGGTSCTPSWNGDDPVSTDTQIGPIVSAIRAAGGDVGVSFGGYGGTKLGQVCGSAQATAAAEQQVINQYGLHYVDFDLEEPEYENATAIANELGAAQILQQDNPGLVETVTLPGTTSGTGYFGQQLLNEAKSLGYTPNAFSIMPFDGGFSGGSSQVTALQDFNTMLVNTFGWSSAYAYAHEGFSGMNGRTDSGEYFYQSDFQTVLNFAEQNGLGRFTFWDANRDRQCNPPSNNGSLSSECSSVPQNSWDFTSYAVAFSKQASVTSPSTTTTTSSGSGGGTSGCAPAWSSSTVYTGGDEVSYNGDDWTAKWWTQGDTPGGPAGVWTDDGPCGSGGGTATTTTTAPATTTTATGATTTTAPSATTTTTAPSATTTTAPAGGGGGTGTVSNGGFETGSLAPWSCDAGTGSVVTSPVHSGTYALQEAPTSSDDAQCSQTVAVSPNTTYTLSAWVQGNYAYLGDTGTGTSDTSNWTSSSGWAQLSTTFTTGASTTSVSIWVHGWYGQGNVYVDDVSLTP
ncbi:MAG TPA: carbohydrate binding domain-containing protein [Acidimicrobiales bacterium]|nr:carbohydrate binding domain-containing protein [Acidimicrobiales bacterium]